MSVAKVVLILCKPRWLVALGWMISYFCVACVTAGVSESAEPLRYLCEPKQKFSYEVHVTIDEDDRVKTLKGNVHYLVDSVEKEQLRITYRGGLAESAKLKQIEHGGVPDGLLFGTRGFPGVAFSPFSRPTFTGQVQSTNRITLSLTGSVLAMDGDSQLPYLLGNLSLLPFEILPESNERQWKVDTGTSITEESNSRRPFGAFGPFANYDTRKVQSASETIEYRVDKEGGELISIKKTYGLKTPVTGENEAFEMTGTGTWVFNVAEHVPESLDMTYQLVVKKGNSSTTFPVSVKFTRISAAQLAKMEADAKRLREEHEQKQAADKLKAETPLTDEQKDSALAVLNSEDPKQLLVTLKELAAKSLAEPDAEIAGAIEDLLAHTDAAIAKAASGALMKWSSSYKVKMELKKAYEGPSPVKSTDREVNSSTPLYVGQIVQAQEHGHFWIPAVVKDLLGDGRVQVEFLAWGKTNRSASLARRSLQLAPEELEQPARPQAARLASPSGSPFSRTWSDATGRFKVEAEFLSSANGKVLLRRSDGREVELPIEKLSGKDQEAIIKLNEEILKLENPFEPKAAVENPFEPK